ncbi:MAG TPA: F0F1 ATP synthase subunit B [Longimicrobiales bacterium]|nr:F0F1 ATP synthase subunit B [Longimicrobiales bacterium]
MNLILLAAAEETPNVFNLSLGVSFWTFIIFILLAWILAKFAFPPILGYAAAREQRIQEALDTAKQQREETQRLLEEQRQELENARQQAQQLLAEGRAGAEKLREDMLVTARSEQEELLERARKEIQREREQAVESLRREAVEIAMAAAGRLVQRKVDTAEDRRLVTEFLQSMDDAGNGRSAGVS